MPLNTKALNGIKVLIVDDTPANIDVLHNILNEQGFQIAVALSGEQGLSYAPQFNPDLILLDIMMPGIDGFETCKKLKSNKPTKDIPVIFLTAKADSEDIVKGFKLGAVDYITKPFQHDEVLVRIETHSKLRQTTKKNEQLIKDLKEAISLLNEAQKENIAKSEFMSRMSHELRTPMHAILGFSQLLEQSKKIQEHDKDRESVIEILKAGKHLLSLINNVLDFSQIEIDAYRNNLKKVCLFESVKNVIISHYPLADLLKIKIVNNISEDNKTDVNGDPKLLHQILEIFLKNAIKYNKESGTVTIEQNISEDGDLSLSVINTGENIPEDMLKKVFEPFFRLETHKNSIDGIGMGLALAKKFAELIGGTVSAKNLPNGCSFNLKMPLSTITNSARQ
jgi:two-component system, sensor histidine kinase and response regulator